MNPGTTLFIGGPLHGQTKHVADRRQPYLAPKTPARLWVMGEEGDTLGPTTDFMTYRPERIGMFRQHVLHIHVADYLSDSAIATHLTEFLLTDLARSLA